MAAVQKMVLGKVAESLSVGTETSDKTTSETGSKSFAQFPSFFATLFGFAILDAFFFKFDAKRALFFEF